MIFDLDIEDLASRICGLGDSINSDKTWDALYDKFEIEPEPFAKLIRALTPLCTVAESELTGVKYRGFADDGYWIVKQGFG